MVRITGSVKDENSVDAPTGDSLSSVVRRRRGNKAKRMSGTDKRVPTQNEPSPSKTPRKERRLSRDNSSGEELRVVFPECSAPSNMRPLIYYDSSHRQATKRAVKAAGVALIISSAGFG